MEAVVNKLRNYLPFSPAREGPLHDLDRVRIELERHARNLADIVNREMAKRSRTEF